MIRRAAVLILATLAGLLMLCWPLIVHGHQVQPPFVFLAILPVILVVVLAELTDGGWDPRLLAVLGILSAVEAVLRGVSAGVAGVELVFFLLILAGRVFGAGFGFVLGCTGLLASALLTAGIGPWLPYQMLVSGWVGLGAGLLPRVRGRLEIVILAVYGVVAAYGYGLLLNLQGWPLMTGVSVPGHAGSLDFVPDASLGHNLATFARYDLLTSMGWDTGRAITSALAIVLLGPAILTTLRRAARRATVSGAIRPSAGPASGSPAEAGEPVPAAPSGGSAIR